MSEEKRETNFPEGSFTKASQERPPSVRSLQGHLEHLQCTLAQGGAHRGRSPCFCDGADLDWAPRPKAGPWPPLRLQPDSGPAVATWGFRLSKAAALGLHFLALRGKISQDR